MSKLYSIPTESLDSIFDESPDLSSYTQDAASQIAKNLFENEFAPKLNKILKKANEPLPVSVEPESYTFKVNNEYVQKIDEIITLGIRFSASLAVVDVMKDIRETYVETGILTKQNMAFLNKMYKIFTFDEKYHPDKETTLGKIKNLLGELDGETNRS